MGRGGEKRHFLKPSYLKWHVFQDLLICGTKHRTKCSNEETKLESMFTPRWCKNVIVRHYLFRQWPFSIAAPRTTTTFKFPSAKIINSTSSSTASTETPNWAPPTQWAVDVILHRFHGNTKLGTDYPSLKKYVFFTIVKGRWCSRLSSPESLSFSFLFLNAYRTRVLDILDFGNRCVSQYCLSFEVQSDPFSCVIQLENNLIVMKFLDFLKSCLLTFWERKNCTGVQITRCNADFLITA